MAPLFELTGNAAERAVERCANRVHGGNDHDRDSGRDEGVFDCGCAGVIIYEAQDKLPHRHPPLRHLSRSPTTMWRSPFDRVNSITKNVDDVSGEYPRA